MKSYKVFFVQILLAFIYSSMQEISWTVAIDCSDFNISLEQEALWLWTGTEEQYK
jgi:hypothetical protein